MVVHVYSTARNSRFSEVLRPTAVGPAVSRTVLVLLLLLFPLLAGGAQEWRLRASLVELPDGVLVDPTQPGGIGYRGFTGLNLLTPDLALLSHPQGELSAFYRSEPLDGGAERLFFRLSDGRTVEMVRVPAAPGRYHYLYRLDSDFFAPSGDPEEGAGEPSPGDIRPEPAGEAPTGNPGGKASLEEAANKTEGAVLPPRILYVGTMTEGT